MSTADWLVAGTMFALVAGSAALFVRCLGRPDDVRDLLARVTHLGRHTRHGHGRVLSWDVLEDGTAREKWRRRVFPDPTGAPDTVRAPYHHPSRRMPCSSTALG